MSGSSPQERKAPMIKYSRSTDTQYELFAKLKIMSVIWIAKRKKAGRISHFLPEISVFHPDNVCLTHKEALITEHNWSSNTRQYFFFFFKEKLFGVGSQSFKTTSYPWTLCSTPYFRGFTGHPRCHKVLLFSWETAAWRYQLCRRRPFFIRAALGLGMYWLLAWCSSSRLKYWIVLFKPSSRGTCQHKTQRNYMKYCHITPMQCDNVSDTGNRYIEYSIHDEIHMAAVPLRRLML